MVLPEAEPGNERETAKSERERKDKDKEREGGSERKRNEDIGNMRMQESRGLRPKELRDTRKGGTRRAKAKGKHARMRG